jgi:hypothetical protein
MTNFKRVLLAATVFGLSHSVSAGTTTWEWDIEGTGGTSTLNLVGTNTDNAKTLNGDLTAFADTGGSDDLTLEQSTNLTDNGSYGWGMKNQDNEGGSPEHAFDNKALTSCPSDYPHESRINANQCYKRTSRYSVEYADEIVDTDYDMALVSFDTSVELKEVGFGWTNGEDTDFTVLAYTGSGTPVLEGNTWAGITGGSSGWDLIGSYRADNANHNNAGYYAINANNVDSQYWLVGAFNDILDTGYTNDGHDTDAFKLQGLKGKTSTPSPKPPQEVPEPAALGLMLLGMFGLYVRRNKTNA